MKILIVSDFDGTINKKDIGEEFARIIDNNSELREQLIGSKISMPDIYRRMLSREGMTLNTVRDFYVGQSVIDEHFIPFLQFIEKHDIVHIIVSDGFDLLIQAALEKDGIEDHICVFANSIRDNGEGITVDFPFMTDDSSVFGVCKKSIVNAFRPYFDRIIYVGNGYSDIDAAPDADIVFARSVLKKYCDENRIPSVVYGNYGDIINLLSRSIKGIIFDLDGTLINSFSAIHESFNNTMRQLGLPEYSYEDVLKTIGMPLEYVMSRINGIHDAEQAVRMFRSHYETVYLGKTMLMPGVQQVIEELYNDGYVMAVSTNKLGKYSRILLDNLGIGGYFKSVVGVGDGLKAKPHADTIDRIAKELELKKDEMVYVGDSGIDAETARNAGVDFIAIATGPSPFYELAGSGAVVVLDTISKLPMYIRPIE